MEFIKRTLTAIVLLVFIYFLAVKSTPLVFFLVLQAVVYLALYELLHLIELKNEYKLIIGIYAILISYYFFTKKLSIDTILLTMILASGIVLLKRINKETLENFSSNYAKLIFIPFYLVFTLNFLFYIWKVSYLHLFFLILIISVGDSAAYFIGSWIGKHKMFPVASPKKSVEGFLASIVFSILTAYIASLTFYKMFPPNFILISGALIPLVAQLSDPVESLFKRAAGVKDSSNILPGHGGFLDRIDSYIFAAPVFFLLIRYFTLIK